ncbi:hypothetical protein BDR05DRAFT_834915, partial [Suillus weaverae]
MSCALRPDGQLKDAKDIEWYNDPDDDSPMPPSPPPATSNGKITAFVSRRSGRPIKPTEKICDAVNSAPAKRPAPAAFEGWPAPKRIQEEPPAIEGLSDEEEEEDREEAYKRTKALGDEDREHRKLMKKDERSADLKTIFTQEKGHMNPHTQERKDSWWCEVCRGNNVPSGQCFFKGSISTRRTHITRNPKCHFPLYRDRCKECRITMHDRAIPLNSKSTDGPQEWELKSEQLAFTIINGNHSGSNIGRILIETINNYDFHTKVGWFTADNATNNDMAIQTVALSIDPSGKEWVAGEHRVRTRTLATCVDDFSQCESLSLEIRVEIREAVIKAVNVSYTQIHAHLQEQGVNRFIQLADDSDEVPNLQGKSYGAFKLSAKEWKKLELMHDVLQEPANAQQSFSATREPTVWHAIPVLEFLQQTWQNMAKSSKFADFSTTIESGIDNLHKWYHKIDETDSKWEPHNFEKGMRRLQIVFDRYH